MYIRPACNHCHSSAPFEQALLHIDLLGLIAGKRRAQAQMPAGLPGLQLLAVIEIAGRLLLAEEQPVAAAGRAPRALEERAKRRHTGAGADHDHRQAVVLGQAEVPGRLREDCHFQCLARSARNAEHTLCARRSAPWPRSGAPAQVRGEGWS
jgi:hypothetical protein